MVKSGFISISNDFTNMKVHQSAALGAHLVPEQG